MVSKCYIESDVQQTKNPDFPTFFGIFTEIFYSMIKMPDEETSKKMRDFLMGKSSDTIGDVINQMIFSQNGPTIFWSFGFFLLFSSIILLISTIVIQYFLCGCEPEKPKRYETRFTSGYNLIAYLLVSSFFISVFAITYDISKVHLTIEIENGGGYLDEVSNKLEKVLTDGATQLECETSKYIDKNFGKFDDLKKNLTKRIVNETMHDIGLIALKNFAIENYTNHLNSSIAYGPTIINSPYSTCKNTFETVENVTGNLKELLLFAQLVNDAKPKISKTIENFQSPIQKIEDETSKRMIYAKQSIKNIFIIFHEMIEKSKVTLKKWMDLVKAERKDFVEGFAYSFTKYFTGILINVISLLTIICSMAAAYLIHNRLRNEKWMKKYVKFILIGFYTAIVFTIFLFIFWIFAFLGGWMISTICLPIFEEDQYEFYKGINFKSPKFRKEVAQINAGQFLRRCNSPQTTTFFAIRGFEFFSATHVKKQFEIVQFHNQARDEIEKLKPEIVKFSTQRAREHLAELNMNYANLKQLINGTECHFDIGYFPAIENIMEDSERFLNLTDGFEMRNITEIFVKNNLEIFEPLRVAISESSDLLIHNLQYNNFKCGPFVHILNTFGTYFCEYLGQPMHAFSASLFLLSLTFLLNSISLLLAYRWLSKPDFEFAKYETSPANPNQKIVVSGEEEPVNNTKTPESEEKKKRNSKSPSS
ncbi:unnamed protein product [Caenorhabditis angaria]|uniref:Uncharacterized protein n=1 Tax=Caenorhabditis angaria TaxID=860376 RepID=A0A9P1IEF1_9PELO|nr:unnamed protein product [Caenorhabditis angaria]